MQKLFLPLSLFAGFPAGARLSDGLLTKGRAGLDGTDGFDAQPSTTSPPSRGYLDDVPGVLRHLRRGIGWRPSSIPAELGFSRLAMRGAVLDFLNRRE